MHHEAVKNTARFGLMIRTIVGHGSMLLREPQE
jgi:hypothetical protein